MTEEKIGSEAIHDPHMLVAALNKQFEKYNTLLKGTAAKDELKQIQAEIIVENKSILERITAEGKNVDEMKKELIKMTEALTKQGEKLTIYDQIIRPEKQEKSLSQAISEKMLAGALNDFIEKKTSEQSFEIQLKDVAFTGTYGSGAAQHAYMPWQMPQYPPLENFDVRLLLPTGIINSEKLDFPTERAASLTDATATAAENGNLGESTFGFTMTTVNSERVGAFVEVSRRALRNTVWLSSYINNRLTALLIKKINSLVIAATGAGTDINGLVNQANAFASATNFSGVSNNPSNMDVLRAAKSDMNSLYYLNANTVLMNPTDAAIAAIAKNTIADYVDPRSFLNANNMGYTGAWGMRFVETADITKGTYLVAAIQQAYMELLFNGSIEVTATNSHASQFIADLITIKIEADIMLPVYNANALMKGTFATDIAGMTAGA